MKKGLKTQFIDRLLSVVVSVYNEEKILKDLYREAARVLKGIAWEYELISANDGSGDRSLSIPKRLAAGDNNVKVASFSRSFGHEVVMIAGLDYSRGDDIICVNVGLQHPPECIPGIPECFEGEYEVINMVCTRNKTTGLVKDMTPSGFYWLIGHVSDVHFEADASDFFAISRHAAQALKENYREKVCLLRGYVQNVGFKRTAIEYEAGTRAVGKSKYSIKKLFVLPINTILCFSSMSLKLGIYAGIFLALLRLLIMIYTLFTRREMPSGYATIVVLICFAFIMMLVIIDIIGEYIAVLFVELKDRSIYIADRTEDFEEIRK